MKTTTIFIILNLIASIIIENMSFLPWWSFLIMSFLMGLIYTNKEKTIRPFMVGFVSGFSNWFLASLFFHFTYDGILMNKVAHIFFVPDFVLFFTIGIIGGILNGLACFSGYSLFVKKDELHLDRF